jgi:tRNA-modifying protein YgfZ
MPLSTAHLCRLTAGFVEVEGDDAETFLHGQLSQRIRGLPGGRAPLAGWHDARGRVRTLMRVLRVEERWLLMTEAAAAARLLQSLGLFVLRSKVELTLASADAWQAAAVVGPHDSWLAARRIELAAEPGSAAHTHGLHWIRVGPDLTHALGRASALEALADTLRPGPEALAELAEIRLGVPSVSPEIAGRYVAQMLNLDTLGAVAFDKGCYPGQEVITRTHNLGAVKRRLRRFSADLPSPPAPATPVTDASGDAAGEVVRAAAVDGRTELLAVVRLDALETPLFAAGSRLRLEPLPFDA